MTDSKELIFGTTNQAKIDQVRGVLEGLAVVRGINEFGIDLIVDENGKTAQENARIKARAYTAALGRTVFAMDNALYLDGLPDNEQPGLHVRRIGGIARATDEEMIGAFREIIADNGGELSGFWEFGVSIAKPDGSSVEASIISPRQFVSKASGVVIPGYPLESIQIDSATGKYVSEMTDEERARFWRQSIGEPLRRFVEAHI